MAQIDGAVVAPLQTSVTDSINQVIADVIAYLPTILGALVILIVGYVVGRLLGGLVTRVVRRLGVDRYSEGTAMEGVGGDDGIARALGKLVSYYVYFVAIIAAADVLAIELLTGLLTELGAFLPVIFGALVVLVIGFVVGRVIGDFVGDLIGGFDVGRYLQDTPLETLGDTEGEFGRIIGTLVTYYVYLITLLAVADILEVTALSSLLQTFAGYLPALVGGLLVLLVGIWAAERIGRLVDEIDDSRLTSIAALVVKVFVYYLTITIALSTIGISIEPLTSLFTSFVVAFFGALALALAIGVGLAVGLGGQEYVAENIDDWMGTLQETATEDE